MLAHAVRAGAWNQARDRGRVDDVPVLAVPVHMRHEHLQAVEHAPEVHAHHPLPGAVGHLPHGEYAVTGAQTRVLAARHAGVVAEDVDVAELRNRAVADLLERLAAHRVDRQAQDRAFFLLQYLDLRLERFLLDVGQHHVHALGGESSGERKAHAARRPRHDRRLACEFAHDQCPLSSVCLGARELYAGARS